MKIYRYFSLALLSLAALVACNKMNDGFENKAFINAENLRNEVRVATDEGVVALTKTITVGIAQPVANDVNVSVVSSPELLETYRTAYYHKDAELLPEANYNLEGVVAKIKAGDVLSSDLELVFDGLDKLDYSKQYVLPVTVATEGIQMLERSKTAIKVNLNITLIKSYCEVVPSVFTKLKSGICHICSIS